MRMKYITGKCCVYFQRMYHIWFCWLFSSILQSCKVIVYNFEEDFYFLTRAIMCARTYCVCKHEMKIWIGETIIVCAEKMNYQWNRLYLKNPHKSFFLLKFTLNIFCARARACAQQKFERWIFQLMQMRFSFGIIMIPWKLKKVQMIHFSTIYGWWQSNFWVCPQMVTTLFQPEEKQTLTYFNPKTSDEIHRKRKKVHHIALQTSRGLGSKNTPRFPRFGLPDLPIPRFG